MNDEARVPGKREPAPSWGAVAAWRKYDEMEARLTRPVSERMLDLAAVSTGMRVLDAACGRGEPGLPAAHRVGPGGWVLGIDLVEDMLRIARERAQREGLTHVELRVGDVEALAAEDALFDVALARWGLMYMRAPERALASIHRALKPGGVLVVASWVEPERVPYASLPRQVLARYRDVPPLVSDGPGTFRHADRARFEMDLVREGFVVEVSEEMAVPVVEATDGRGIVAWIRELGGQMARLVAELAEEQQRAWEDDLCRELEKERRGERVSLGGVTRITLARRGR